MAVTFDPANKGTLATLSGGNLTSTVSSAAGFAIARSTTSYLLNAAGLVYFEGLASSGIGVTGNSDGIGICLTGVNLNDYLGSDAAGIGWYDTGAAFFNGSGVAGINPFANGATVAFALNLGTGFIWITPDAGVTWNSGGTASPITGVGGYSIGGFGSVQLFAAVVGINRNSQNSVWTAKFAAPFTNSTLFASLQAVGYTAWDPGGAATAPFVNQMFDNPGLRPRRTPDLLSWLSVPTLRLPIAPPFQNHDFPNPTLRKTAPVNLSWQGNTTFYLPMIPPFVNRDFPNPTLPIRRTDHLTWLQANTLRLPVAPPFLNYDQPNPTLRKTTPVNLTHTSDYVRRLPFNAPILNYDQPNPQPKRYPVDNLTWVCDRVRYLPFTPPVLNYDQPNPTLRKTSPVNLTWAQNTTAYFIVAMAQPFNQYNYPNPRGPAPLNLSYSSFTPNIPPPPPVLDLYDRPFISTPGKMSKHP